MIDRRALLAAAPGLLAAGCGPASGPATGEPALPLSGGPDEQAAMRALYRQALAAGEREVVVYQAATDPEWQGLWIEFARTFPGLRVVYLHVTPGIITDRLDIERATGARFADVVSQAVNQMGGIAERGYFETWTPVNAAVVPERFRDPKGRYFYGYSKLYGFAYNTRQVAEAELPGSLEEMLHPRWKGRFEYVFPGRGGGITDVAVVTLRERGAVTDDMLERMKANGRTSNGPELSVGALAQGRTALAPWAYLAPFERQRRLGAPIAIRYVRDLSLSVPYGQALAREAAHPNAARLLLTWLLSPRAQTLFAVEAQAQGLRVGAPPPAGYPQSEAEREALESPPPAVAGPLIQKTQIELREMWQSGPRAAGSGRAA